MVLVLQHLAIISAAQGIPSLMTSRQY